VRDVLSIVIIDMAALACGFIIGAKGGKLGVPMWQCLVASQFTCAACIGVYVVAR
jgi:hypothetical protein